MPKFNILYSAKQDSYANKQMADCQALALAIGYYFNDADIILDYTRRHNGRQLIIGENVFHHKLLWFKYFLNKPLLLAKKPAFELIYMGINEHNDMLSLCNTNLFASCSYGLQYNANSLKQHISRHPLALQNLNRAYSEAKAALITSSNPFSNQLIEAIAYNTNIVFTKSAKNKPWLTAKLPEDVKHIITKTKEQEAFKHSTFQAIKQNKITKNELQRLST